MSALISILRQSHFDVSDERGVHWRVFGIRFRVIVTVQSVTVVPSVILIVRSIALTHEVDILVSSHD